MKKLFVSLTFLFCIFLSLRAQDATALYDEGVKLKDAKKISEAADKFKQAIQIKPEYTEAIYELG